MCVVTITTGKTFSRDDKMIAFVLWKAKLPLKDIINQRQLAKTTLKRILMLTRTVQRIPAQELFKEHKNSYGAKFEEVASVY
jgi:hypothetical protein